MTEGDKKQPWWENNVIVVSLSLIGINTSEFPGMFSREFFMTDLFLKLVTLPIGVILIRAMMRKMDIE